MTPESTLGTAYIQVTHVLFMIHKPWLKKKKKNIQIQIIKKHKKKAKINKKTLTFLTKRRKNLFGRAALVERPGLWGGARGGLGNEAQRAIRAVADEQEMDG